MTVLEITEEELATGVGPDKGAVVEISEEELAPESGVLQRTGEQFLGGISDVTSAIAGPLERTFGTVLFTDEGIEMLGPEEVQKRQEEGEAFGFGAREEPRSIFEAGARIGGQTAALGPILGRAAGFITPSKTVAATKLGRLMQLPRSAAATAGQTFKAAPAAATAIETGLGVTAGAGGYIAQQIVPDSDAAKITGEIIGGTLPSLTPTSLAIKAAGGVKSLIQRIKRPFTTRGGQQRAAARAQRALPAEERVEALAEIAKETTIDPITGQPVLTPTQRSGAPGMLSLERAVMESSEQLSREADSQISRANEVIQESLEQIGAAPDEAVISTLEESSKYLDNLLETRLRVAAQSVDESVEALGPSVTREQANLIAREQIEGALNAARAQEKELYALLPEDIPVPFSETKAAFDDFGRELGKAQLKDIPGVAKQFLGDKSKTFFGKVSAAEKLPKGMITLKDLRSLQSELRAVARNARAGDKRNLNMARIADDLASTIADDLAKVSDPDVAEAVQLAVSFSRNLNERFSKGTVGKILGKRVTGEARVAPGLTLEQTIGMSGPKAREALDDLVKAIDSPEAPGSQLLISSTEDYMRSRFLSSAVERGVLNQKAAQRFITRNEEMLKRLPNLRRQIDETIDAGDALSVAQRNRKRIALDDPRASKATMMIQKGPVEAFKQMGRLKPAKAATEVQKLINAAAKDKTGEAAEGLRSGFVEFLLTGARQKTRDASGRPLVSGFALRDSLNDESIRSIATRVLSPEEQNRLGVVIRDLIKLEKRLAARTPVEGIIGDTPSKLVETIAGITGAAAGRAHAQRMGIGGTVQIPGIMADRFRELVKNGVKDPAGRLLRDAVADESLFKELLEEPLEKGAKLSKTATRRLNAWFAAVMADHGGMYEQE